MRVIIGLGTYLLAGYLCGMGLSSFVHADLALTAWTNVWVYFWLLLWPLGLVWWLMVAVGNLVLAVLVVAAAALLTGWVVCRVRGR